MGLLRAVHQKTCTIRSVIRGIPSGFVKQGFMHQFMLIIAAVFVNRAFVDTFRLQLFFIDIIDILLGSSGLEHRMSVGFKISVFKNFVFIH